jgi:hypothetical protein
VRTTVGPGPSDSRARGYFKAVASRAHSGDYASLGDKRDTVNVPLAAIYGVEQYQYQSSLGRLRRNSDIPLPIVEISKKKAS